MGTGIVDRIHCMTLRQKYFYAFLSGIISVGGLAPVNLWPLSVFGFAAFLILLPGIQTKRRLFYTGAVYGIGYFIAGLYWISFALHIDIQKWWWLVPFAIIGLPLALSIFYGLATLCLWPLRHSQLRIILGAVLSFSIAEFLRGYLFTGFPWNLSAYIWLDTPVAAHMSIIGAYGLTLITFMLSALLCCAYARPINFIFPLLFLGALWGAGYASQSFSQQNILNEPLRVMLVQPNIPQKEKWDRSLLDRNFKRLKDLTRRGQEQAKAKADLIIWPETALSTPVQYIDHRRADLADLIENDQELITGILDYGDDGFHNSLITLNSNGDILKQYNKHHLVPFGEYVPFRKYLSIGPVASALETTGDFTPGPGPRNLETVKNKVFSPMICYEIIFPGRIFSDNPRPDFIVNITNDAWYLNSAGPYQHLTTSRARAIETGLPVIRVANTGISAVISPTGKIVQSISLTHEGVKTVLLPPAHPTTPYNRHKNLAFFGMVVILTLFLMFKKTILKNSFAWDQN